MFLQISHIHKSFGQEHVLNNLSFSLERHQTLSILGRSGSGKTTLLKILAGLEQPDSGELRLEGKTINDVPAHRRNMVYLYQEPLLFPHLNIFDNVAFGLRLRKEPAPQVRQAARAMLEELELTPHAAKMPHQISGGQCQRAAFGRALIINPNVLLLDEPFGALDAETRQTMQQLFKRMAAEYRITALFVTHDLKEALLMGDEMAMMQTGQLKRYESKKAFMEDAETGVRKEMAFWKAMEDANRFAG